MSRKPRVKKFRYAYREHTDMAISTAIKVGVPENGVFDDWLTEQCLAQSFNTDALRMAFMEGRRDLAGQILSIAHAEMEDS